MQITIKLHSHMTRTEQAYHFGNGGHMQSGRDMDSMAGMLLDGITTPCMALFMSRLRVQERVGAGLLDGFIKI